MGWKPGEKESEQVKDKVFYLTADQEGDRIRGSFCLPKKSSGARYLLGLSFDGEISGDSWEPVSCDKEASPFLTVVMRTQGVRPAELTDALLCLAAQEDEDFEVILVGHNVSAEVEPGLRKVLEEIGPLLGARLSYQRVDGGTRVAPLQWGFRKALGEYVAVLDDDDLVTQHWVAVFHELSKKNSGQILHSYTVAQPWSVCGKESRGDWCGLQPDGPMEALYCSEYNPAKQMIQNACPLMSLAFPRFAFRDIGITFDDALTTVEDWDFLMRTYALCGVATEPLVTAVYRHWTNAATSHTVHSSDEWNANYARVIERINASPYLLDQGGVEAVRRAIVGDPVPQPTLVPEVVVDKGEILGAFVAFAGSVPDGATIIDEMRRLYDDLPSNTTGVFRWIADDEEGGSSIRPEEHPLVTSLAYSPGRKGGCVLGQFELEVAGTDGKTYRLDFSNLSRCNGLQVDCNHIVFLKGVPYVLFELPKPLYLKEVHGRFELKGEIPDFYIDQVVRGNFELKAGRARRWLRRRLGLGD